MRLSLSRNTLCYICLFFYEGARETDYPAGEEVTQNAEAPPARNGSSLSASSSSAGGDAVLGGITVVGCEAEGMTAVAQNAVLTVKDVEAGQSPSLSSRLSFDSCFIN